MGIKHIVSVVVKDDRGMQEHLVANSAHPFNHLGDRLLVHLLPRLANCFENAEVCL